MSVDISAQFKDKEVRKFLSDVVTRQKLIDKSHKKYIGVISALVYGDIIDHFEKERGPDGPWKEWSDSYAKIRGSGKILQNSGDLRKNIKPIESGRNFRKKSNAILWYNNAKTKDGFPYAYAHDNDEAPRKTLPRRSFMWLSDLGMKKISDQTLRFLAGEK